jgi:mono/diheme cytochrome c family protein
MAQPPSRIKAVRHANWRAFIYLPWFLALPLLLAALSNARAEESPASALYPKQVYSILSTYCFDCHGDGMENGKVAFDAFKSHEEMVGRRELWMMVLKNTRTGIMPPAKKPRPNDTEREALEQWIKEQMFQLDRRYPDPGRVTLRRLNRTEYRNTIRDLTGYNFNAEEELPPDDTGYGFDTIGDVLTVSPLLLEKYMSAAEVITAQALPRSAGAPAELSMSGADFRPAEGGGTGELLSYYQPAQVSHALKVEHTGTYEIKFEFEIRGEFEFDPGKCRITFKADGQQLWTGDFGWQNGKKFNYEVRPKFSAGNHQLDFVLEPLTPVEQRKNKLQLRVGQVLVRGPLEEQYWVRPKNFERFFWKEAPQNPAEQRKYATEVLRRFAAKAYRRPIDEAALHRLVSIAEGVYGRPGKRFEDGIAEAMIPILASPRFLFRVEGIEPGPGSAKYPFLDEYALASRLSYFLWSTMPDDELLSLARQHQLRQNLQAQVKRMVDDPRSQALVENFVGQWLQVRDLEGINIDERTVLARDRGEDRALEQRRKRFRELNAIPEDQRTPEQAEEIKQLIEQRRKRQAIEAEVQLDHDLRRALRNETQMYFAYVMHQDRDVMEFINSDYAFLNERLAHLYGITNVTGKEMRRVTIPEGSPRGGILTDGSVLIVTSNPTRTSPVKRGLFILDTILGAPPPPPPANVPPLEASEKESGGRPPTLRETLELHRSKPLCSSCHNRMDPLGLALENFNALGMWRNQERGVPIDAAGMLITGESFQDVRDVKQAIVTQHRVDFYRCLAEKLMTYALGRGLEYYDVESVDRIVERLEKENGRFSALLAGIIESAPFQRTRGTGKPVVKAVSTAAAPGA